MAKYEGAPETTRMKGRLMAKNRMLQFVTVAKETPEKRPATLRAQDFHEIYREYAAEKAAEQAGRCSQCGVPYCQSHCPLHNNIPDWLRLTAEGRLQEAYEISQATNTFPEICGRICPQDRLCEGNCVIEQSGHGTVTIGSVEKYITDLAWENGWVQPIRPHAERTESVGIIGAGPGGLAAADALRRKGVQVTVYDRYDRAGGLLTYGIPGFKLEKPVVMQRIEQLVRASVGFDQERGDQISVINVKFPVAAETGGVEAANPLKDFDKNDIMRAVELAVLAIVGILMIFFVARPLLGAGGGKKGKGAAAGGGADGGQSQITRVMVMPDGQQVQVAADGSMSQLALPGPGGDGLGLEMANAEGQARASKVKQVSEFVAAHPDESVSILRSWLHETA
jgi:hypothetical protein